MRPFKRLVAAIFSTALSACGGGSSSDDSVKNPPLTDSQIRALLQSSQSPVPKWDVTQAAHVPSDGTSAANQTYRWNVERDGLIPVKGLDISPYVAQALDEIEQHLGRQIFDRVSLASTAESAVLRGLIIRSRTLPPISGVANHCGMVHRISADMDPPGWIDTTQSMNPIVSSDWQTAMLSTSFPPRPQWYIDVDLSNSNCAPFKELIVHELGHTLGLSQHFDGFGQGNCSGVAICQDRFYPVLKTLYGNAPGTYFQNLTTLR